MKLTDLPAAAQEQARKQLSRQDGNDCSTGETHKISHLEMLFDAHLKTLAGDLPKPECEYLFARESGRMYRFDRCWPGRKIAVELDGGVHTGGRHVRGEGFTEDCRKLNLAATLGWTVLRFTTDMLVKDPAQCFSQVRTCLFFERNASPGDS